MKNETKTSLKIIVLFFVIVLSAVTILVYFSFSKNVITQNKENVERQENTLNVIRELIVCVNKSKQSLYMYAVDSSRIKVNEIYDNIDEVDSIAKKLAIIYPDKKEDLLELPLLLHNELDNLQELWKLLKQRNPVEKLSDNLQKTLNVNTDTIVVQAKKDTIISIQKRKKFFKRFGELFKPKKDTIHSVIISKDTIMRIPTDSIRISKKTDEVAYRARVNYIRNITNIMEQINLIMASNYALSSRINIILYELNNIMLTSSITAMEKSEDVINWNYKMSIIGGGIALFFIILLVLMIVSDINRVQLAKRELETANKRVKEIMDSRHKLMLATTHDIKSPLNSIMGYLEMSDNKNEDIQAMQHSAEYILALLENMLNFSSIEQGSLSITKTKFSIDGFMKDISGLFNPLAKAKQLYFNCEYDNELIESDAMKIKQILINIVSNAIKYTSKGGVSVSLSCIQSDSNTVSNFLHIVVEDTGLGIPENEIENIFKPFVRVERNNKYAKGNGYGMFVVKGLVDLLNGKINIESVVNEGTKILIDIPVTCIKKEHATRKRIVVFDDDVNIELLSGKILTQLGHTIVDDDYDMILTDLEMNEINGYDILKSAGTIPVVLMTGRADISQEKAIKDGFFGFIQKPVTIEKLRAVFGDASSIKV